MYLESAPDKNLRLFLHLIRSSYVPLSRMFNAGGRTVIPLGDFREFDLSFKSSTAGLCQLSAVTRSKAIDLPYS
jgi:hypothetical protein